MFSRFGLCILAACWLPLNMNANAAPTAKTSAKPLSPRQKQLQAALWREIGNMRKPTSAQKARIEKLLRVGAPVNAPDKDGILPLMASVTDESLVALFLRYGANPNAADADGATPLHISAMMGAPGTARRLIRAGARLEARNKNGETPLMLAASPLANLSNVRDLIAAGANLEARDKRGITALTTAAITENGAPLARLLLDAGARTEIPDDDGATPLIAAALTGHADVLELLLSHGANANAHDKKGQTALDAARSADVSICFCAERGAHPVALRAKEPHRCQTHRSTPDPRH